MNLGMKRTCKNCQADPDHCTLPTEKLFYGLYASKPMHPCFKPRTNAELRVFLKMDLDKVQNAEIIIAKQA